MPITCIRQLAFKLLARREYSYFELKTKFQNKKFSPSEIRAELGFLQEEGLQSDERFAKGFTNERIRLGYGPRAIRYLLAERGVAESLIARYISVYSESFWQEHLQAVQEKRFGRSATPFNLAEKTRQYRFLVQRGFDSQAVHRLLKQVSYEQ